MHFLYVNSKTSQINISKFRWNCEGSSFRLFRTGLLHVGDRLVALNGRKMTCVDEAIALIDTIPMGEIVSVTVHKEEEVQGIHWG